VARILVVALAIVATLGVVACGGSDEAEPLTLEQRLPGEAEARTRWRGE
jgi:hypothetical protein